MTGTPQSEHSSPASQASQSSQPDQPAERLLTLLQLESEVRQAESLAAAWYVMVNRTRLLLPSRQTVLFGGQHAPHEVVAVSDVSAPDANAPYVRWLQRLNKLCLQKWPSEQMRAFTASDFSPLELPDWEEWGARHLLWAPLRHHTGGDQGHLVLMRDEPWDKSALTLAARLAETYAHALWAFRPKPTATSFLLTRKRMAATLAIIGACLLIPVRQSVLAPGEVTPMEPLMVSAPLDGVVESFQVAPNAAVTPGQPLFRFEDTTLRNEYALAQEELAVAEAELLTAKQGGFHDARQRAMLSLLQSRRDIHAARVAYAKELLDRIQVNATRTGVAVFRDANDWIGQPVRTGEKIMLLADPHATELSFSLPVKDALILKPGAPVVLYLDVDPLHPVDAVLERVSYEASVSDEHILSYRGVAQFAAPEAQRPRLGLRGVAKIMGGRVPLGLYLFRKPLAIARQYVGF